MKATFSTYQDLKSLEFGTLLHDIVMKGVYIAPTVTISSGIVSVQGGTYLFYDNVDSSYAVRVEYESTDAAITLSGVSAGDYIYAIYEYSSVAKQDMKLVKSTVLYNDTYKNGILLCRIPTAYTVDTSVMEMAGPSYSYQLPLVKYLQYAPGETSLKIAFNGKVLVGKTFVTPADSTFAIDPAKAYFVYIDSAGSVNCIESIESGYSRLIVAVKPAGNTSVFEVLKYPIRSEITDIDIRSVAKDLVMSSLTWNDVKDGAESKIYENGKETGDKYNLAKLLEQSIQTIDLLVEKCVNLESRIETLEKYKTNLSKKITDDSTATLTVTNIKVTDKSEMKTITLLDGSSFGTSSNPIKNLYCTGAVYFDSLEIKS